MLLIYNFGHTTNFDFNIFHIMYDVCMSFEIVHAVVDIHVQTKINKTSRLYSNTTQTQYSTENPRE